MLRWIFSPWSRQEHDEDPVNADDDPYDPAKPEYLIPASVEEVEAGELELLENQIACLEDSLAKRLDTLDPEVAKHYSSILDEMYESGGKKLRHVRTASCPGHLPSAEESMGKRRHSHMRSRSEPATPQGALEEDSIGRERLASELDAHASLEEAKGHDPFSNWDDEGSAVLTEATTTTPAESERERVLTVETVILEAEAPPGWETDSEAGDAEEEKLNLGGQRMDPEADDAEEEEVDDLTQGASLATGVGAVAEVAPSPQQGEVHGQHRGVEDILRHGAFEGYEGIVDLNNPEQICKGCEGRENENSEHDAPSIARLISGSSNDLQKKVCEINEVIRDAEAKELNEVETAEVSTLWRVWEVISLARLTT